MSPSDPLSRHRVTWLALALAVSLQVSLATRDPANAFLGRAAHAWVDPSAAEGMGLRGPFATDFRLRVTTGPREVRVRVMGRVDVISDDGTVVATVAQRDHPWSNAVDLRLAPGAYRLHAEHPRWKPVVELDTLDTLPPLTLTVLDAAGSELPAATVASRFEVASALGGPARALARMVPFLAILAILALALAGRDPASQPRARPALVATAVVAHALLALWNVGRYPPLRGLDAEGHLAYVHAILEHHSVPPAATGFVTYHPPLFHTLGAIAIAVTGSENAVGYVSAGAGIALVLVIARTLGYCELGAIAAVAFAPVLLVSEPQASNEVLFALLATLVLTLAARPHLTARQVVLLGVATGAALLTKYTGVLFLVAASVTLWTGPAPWRRRFAAIAGVVVLAMIIGGAPYWHRWLDYGNPLIGNWDDALGQHYRQPPGLRTTAYFTRFGASLEAHPFRAREASLWDSLYVSAVGDGFGRVINSDAQHAANAALGWLALPLAVVTGAGWLRCVWAPANGLERATGYAVLLGLGSMIWFNLELPYWSAAKAVFLLGLLLPIALSYARGQRALRGRSPVAARAVDVATAIYLVVAAATFVYR